MGQHLIFNSESLASEGFFSTIILKEVPAEEFELDDDDDVAMKKRYIPKEEEEEKFWLVLYICFSRFLAIYIYIYIIGIFREGSKTNLVQGRRRKRDMLIYRGVFG